MFCCGRGLEVVMGKGNPWVKMSRPLPLPSHYPYPPILRVWLRVRRVSEGKGKGLKTHGYFEGSIPNCIENLIVKIYNTTIYITNSTNSYSEVLVSLIFGQRVQLQMTSRLASLARSFKGLSKGCQGLGKGQNLQTLPIPL